MVGTTTISIQYSTNRGITFLGGGRYYLQFLSILEKPRMLFSGVCDTIYKKLQIDYSSSRVYSYNDLIRFIL